MGADKTDWIFPLHPGHRVCALIITYNRKDLLVECLNAILAQTRPPDRIIVVDNASTDGTAAHLRHCGLLDRPELALLRLEVNCGPAGGFHAGFRAFQQSDCQLMWAMDDDVVADPTALEALLRAHDFILAEDGPPGYLVSIARSPEGAMMNTPQPDLRQINGTYADWNRFLSKGLVKLRKSTFVSILLPRQTLCAVGMPHPDFFMWGEDIDYTLRVTAWRPGWQVGQSTVVHCRATARPPGVEHEADPGRFPLLFYFYRNVLYLRRRYEGRLVFLLQAVRFSRAAIRSITMRPFSWVRVRSVCGGVLAGLVFNPSARETALRPLVAHAGPAPVPEMTRQAD